MKRPLDDKRLGLLMRMTGLRSVVCSKRVQEPLLRRGFSKQTKPGTYEITPAGKKYAMAEAMKRKNEVIETYPILCIGAVVGIVEEKSE